MKEKTRLFAVLIFLMGIAGIFILYLSWPSITGKTMVLAIRPVDPFDVLRGQYIILNYDISSLPEIQDANEGDGIYVSLEKDGSNVWRFSSASLEKPLGGDFIKGIIEYKSQGRIRVKYGIEQFFFERDASFDSREMTVEVKVSSSGQARISRLLKDGKPIEISYKVPKLTS